MVRASAFPVDWSFRDQAYDYLAEGNAQLLNALWYRFANRTQEDGWKIQHVVSL